MKRFDISIDIDAPPERVYEVIADVDRWHEWTPSITSVKRFGGAPLAAGTAVAIRQPKLPPARWKVTEISPGHGFTWVSAAPGFRVYGKHHVVPRGSGSRATLAVEMEGLLAPLWAKLTGEITVRYIGYEAEGLKARSENPSYRHGGIAPTN